MMTRGLVLGATVAAIAGVPSPTLAQMVDPFATSVRLESNCGQLDDCFESTAELTEWLWGDEPLVAHRQNEPSLMDMVHVAVGPGEFGPFVCDNLSGSGDRGFVSVSGAGREISKFVGTQEVIQIEATTLCEAGVTSAICTHLSFRDLTAQGPGTGAVFGGGGLSLWDNVDIVMDDSGSQWDPNKCGAQFAWYDDAGAGVHFFWNTRFRSKPTIHPVTFVDQVYSGQDEAWIYGSDFLFEIPAASGPTPISVISNRSFNGIRVFGSTIRLKVLPGVDIFGTFIGVLSNPATCPEGPCDSQFHMHGSIMNLNAGNAKFGPVVAISAADDTFVHTPGSAFVLTIGNGLGLPPGVVTATRISAAPNATVQSPFTWPSGTSFPDILSQTGSDLFVKTNEGPNQDEPRLFVYDSACTARWRNMTSGSCF